jgi:ABC-2 type transport system permease protein
MRGAGVLRLLPYILSISYAAGLVFGSMNSIAPTAASREGKDFEINKFMPLSFRQIMWGKLLPSFIMGAVMLTLVFVFLTAAAILPAIFLAVAAPAAIAGLAQQGFTGLAIDFAMPKLNWDNETAAVKRNLNVMINLLVTWGAAAILILASFYFKNKAGYVTASFITAGFIIALTAAAWLIIDRISGPRSFRAI